MQTVTMPMETLAELIQVQLDNGGKANLTVTGNSMRPMLTNRRDSVTLVRTDKYTVGQIPLFRRDDGAYVLHRIIEVTEDGYICCGDNQAIREPVREDQMVAVVAEFVKNGKHHTVEQPLYRFYSAVWMKLFPIRKLYYRGRRFLGRIRRKFFVK
jgi:phage repressor protein C with HTH and peptisase S24 domain